MNTSIREMSINDFPAVLALWQQTEYLTLNECDTEAGINLYLRRNPGLCFVAIDNYSGQLVAATLCGHDGRRGMLRHLAVAQSHRGQGLSRQLVAKALDGLATTGIGKCNIFVEDDNLPGLAYWQHLGWLKLDDSFRTLQTGTAK